MEVVEPRKFKVGDRVRVTTGESEAWAGKTGFVQSLAFFDRDTPENRYCNVILDKDPFITVAFYDRHLEPENPITTSSSTWRTA